MADPTEYINLAIPIGAQVFSSSFVGDCFAVDPDALVSRAMDAPVHHTGTSSADPTKLSG